MRNYIRTSRSMGREPRWIFFYLFTVVLTATLKYKENEADNEDDKMSYQGLRYLVSGIYYVAFFRAVNSRMAKS